MQWVRLAEEGVIGKRLTENGQAAAVQGQSGDRCDQNNSLVEHDEDGRRGMQQGTCMRERASVSESAISETRIRETTTPCQGLGVSSRWGPGTFAAGEGTGRLI